MGFLDELFGTNNKQQGGGISPITLGLLALLAYRTFHGRSQASGAPVPQGTPAPMPQRAPDAAGAGGIGDILGGLLGGGQQPGAQPGAGGGALNDLLRGGLGGLLGGAAAGTVLNGGLGSLLEQLRQAGHTDTANSWVGTGTNRAIDPQALEHALGRDTLETLAQQSGRPYMDVLSELSENLPDAVDKLTPQGRMATQEEAEHWA